MCLSLIPVVTWCTEPATANEIVTHCIRKPGGSDQAGRLDFTIEKSDGTVTFRRLFHYRWKDYEGSGAAWARLTLLTREPPDNKGTNYLRWEYTTASGKTADQWIYLPSAHKVRRLAMRDPRDSDWGIIGEDLQIRQRWENNRLLKEEQDGDRLIYHIESVPDNTDSIYGKVITRFVKQDAWDTCVPWITDFYDRDGQKIKTLTADWSKAGDNWVRDKVVVMNNKTGTRYRYVFSGIIINNNFSDEQFSVRNLPRPYVEQPGGQSSR